MDERIVKALEDIALILRRGFQAQMSMLVLGVGLLGVLGYLSLRASHDIAVLVDGNSKLILEVLHRLPPPAP